MNINQISNNDCIEDMKNMESGSIDCIITDPPYGINFQSNRSINGPRYDVLHQDDEVNTIFLNEAFRVIKDGGGLLLFTDWKVSEKWKTAIENAGFQIKSQVVWNRLHHGMGDLKGAFAPMHDLIWYACKGRRIFVNGRPKSVFEHKRPSPSQDFGHPTCKPVDLMKDLILAIDDGSDGIIYDPFMGSGSTGVAAISLGRKFIGSEISKEYFDIATKRMLKACDERG